MLPLDLPDFTLISPRRPGLPHRVVIVPMVPTDDDDDDVMLPELITPQPETTLH
ncbi:hypothetical protein [Chitinolyticbacter meiyuanensis]|uniref:hypothetical protein n=1 Tax=Chitinolyticbacter meiyuanensis TaxID=682798 RepID=UPI001651C445|nr:hypothetical protein [Chitinolyticbacter meiyuanensis]